MKIHVENEQEELLIKQLCDVALKTGGLRNMPAIQVILGSIHREDIPATEPPKGE